MARLWKRGTNLSYTGLFSIGLFIFCLLLLGWLPTQAALLVDDGQEEMVSAVVATNSCIRVNAGTLTIDVIGYQDQGDGTTKIVYLVTNTGKKPIKNLMFGIGNGQPVAPTDGSIYSGVLGEYQVKWAGPNIQFKLDRKPEKEAGKFDIFEMVVRGFDPTSEIQIVNEGGQKPENAAFRLSENNGCRGQSRRVHKPSKEAEVIREHVAKREGIPVHELKLVSEHVRTYPNLEREFQAVALLDTRPDGIFYHVMIDQKSGEIIDNISTIHQAESAAHFARYGKIDQQLYERLQEIDDDTVLPIAVWVNGASSTDRQEVEQAVANRHPEARQALRRGNRLWAVDDQELSNDIRREYERLSTERTERRTRPLIEFMQRKFDAEVATLGYMPAVEARLTKKQIHTLEKRPQVGRIYLAEMEIATEAQTAIQTQSVVNSDIHPDTDMVPPVWDRGIDGSGVRIAILEPNDIDAGVSCLTIIAQETGGVSGSKPHKTQVASIAACNDTSSNNNYDGIAPGASVLSASPFESNSGGDFIPSLLWATEAPQNAKIVSMSYNSGLSSQLNYLDRAFDYWSRERDILVVKSSGNLLGLLSSPGKAWNVLTVGATDDKNTKVWHADIMMPGSGYKNLAGSDREKPEVVAPGVDITTYDAYNNIVTQSGTSFAAPQVAGLAALLIDRSSSLGGKSEAMKAIIMASATNNILGPSMITTLAGDLQDGAGAINALHADDIAQNYQTSSTASCTTSCWWHQNYSSFSPLVTTRYFTAYSGGYIRIVLSWLAKADGPSNYNNHMLSTNLDLSVEYLDQNSNNWQSIASSASMDNNYEMVGFHANESGQYRIKIHQHPSSESNNSVGIALLNLPYRAGDVNCDGQLNVVDALFILRSESGTTPLNNDGTCASTNPIPTLRAACNLDGNSQCDHTDGLFMLQCDVGLTNAFCPPNRDEPAIYIPNF